MTNPRSLTTFRGINIVRVAIRTIGRPQFCKPPGPYHGLLWIGARSESLDKKSLRIKICCSGLGVCREAKQEPCMLSRAESTAPQAISISSKTSPSQKLGATFLDSASLAPLTSDHACEFCSPMGCTAHVSSSISLYTHPAY